jgi:hypothetical protein
VADEAALAQFATWCERYTPMAASDLPDGIWLDITGCTAVFDAEAALAQDLAPRLERNAIPCCLAIAGTTGAACALAHMLERFRRAVLGGGLPLVTGWTTAVPRWPGSPRHRPSVPLCP